MSRISDEELTKFGIQFRDETMHPFDPGVEWWNESWFWDWYNDDGSVAGHCRVGYFPSQKRGWIWFHLYVDGEWIVIEEPRLPLADFQTPRIAYEGWGLRLFYDPSEPLRRGRFRFEGFGRVTAGRRVGMMLPVSADLDVVSIGAPHSTGRNNVPGHTSDDFDACRFEQPVTLSGDIAVGGRTIAFNGRGERDHSWGPRPWNMEWTFFALNGENQRVQCVQVKLPGMSDPISVGYINRDVSQNLSAVNFNLKFDNDNVLCPISGHIGVVAEDGSEFGGRLEVISAMEIDITHTFVPPERPIYRRALVRVHPDDGSKPLLGWAEFNYFLK